MRYGLRSLRRRIIALSLFLALLLLGAGGYADRQVHEAVLQAQENLAAQQTFRVAFYDLRVTVYSLEGAVYRYAIVQDGAARAKTEWMLRAMAEQKERLKSSAAPAQTEGAVQDVAELLDSIEAMTGTVHKALLTIADLGRRFPASPIIEEYLFPLNRVFLERLDGALLNVELESEEVLGQMTRAALREIRYLWAQQVSTTRMYVANRSGMFGHSETGLQQLLIDREAYVSALRRHLDMLQKQTASPAAPLLQQALVGVVEVLDAFESHFSEVVSIQQQGLWRGDVAMLRDELQPMLAELRQRFETIDHGLQASSVQAVMGSLQLAERLTGMLWRIAAAAIFLLALGYLFYELTIRRPIDQVVLALQALGQGEAYTPLMKTHTYETEVLLQAFRDMQNQVQQREVRLISILDNASDGIITINEEGHIATFNAAAERLFQYSAEEIIGQKVNRLMPSPVSEEHDAYIRRYIETGEQRILSSELNVTAQRRDGSLFPVSIKVSEMHLDGRRYFTAIMADISERKAMMDRLRFLAEHDALTGLHNRQFFSEELERVVQRALRQTCAPFALLYVDLDNFKFVNDSLGHLAGDQVLVEIAGMLEKRSRKTDLLARLGGDEFAALLYGVNPIQAQQVAENYRLALADYVFRHQGRVVDVGCSIGVAVFDSRIRTREELMVRADIACHMAKRAGRNAVHVYAAEDRANLDVALADMGWTRRIKQALEHNGFLVAIQPIVSIRRKQVSGYELLLRMRGENGEIIAPSSFITAAERFGLISSIDRWVVRRALALLAGQHIEPGMRLSINLSAVSIGDNELLELIGREIRQRGIEAHRLTFELTETAAMNDLAAAIDFLARLQALGCATALDDFGVGYSSFAYLKDLPVDYVKIDGSFVRDIVSDGVQLAMVKSMNEIARAMGKQTVAEFVENEDVLRMLGEIGVDYAQGYFTGRPRLLDGEQTDA